ncbi:MAG: NTP transferase domain-containing protein [Candidatus Aegiribacteria sp.]|nr:NTP transferase domain-containing protein [Candidatus Aegiribacteria sp.]
MHAIIPVAGKGTRMRPLTWSVPKVLIRLAGNTVLGHIIDKLTASGVNHITLIVGYLGDEIVKWTRLNYPDIQVDYAVQERMDGLASAIYLAEPMTDDGQTLVVLGDTIFRADLKLAYNDDSNMIAVKRVEDPRRFGVVVLDGSSVKKLVEKPSSFISDLAIVGIYGFSSGSVLMDAISRLIASGTRTKGEFQLTDAMQLMLEEGRPFGCFEVEDWYDCGKPETVLETNRILLDMGTGLSARDHHSSVIIPPVSIDEDVEIVSSIVGPYVSIASGSTIQGSILSNSIVGFGTTLRNVNIHGSIIGNEAEISSTAVSINAGSSCRIEV